MSDLRIRLDALTTFTPDGNADAAPVSPELAKLIAAHHRADVAVDKAYEVYYADYNSFLQLVEPLAPEGAPFDPLHLDASRKKFESDLWIIEPMLTRVAAFAHGDAKARLDGMLGELLQVRRDMFEDLCARTAEARRVSGLELSEPATDVAEKEELVALAALCEFPCATLADIRAKVAHLVSLKIALDDEHVETLLRSIVGASNAQVAPLSQAVEQPSEPTQLGRLIGDYERAHALVEREARVLVEREERRAESDRTVSAGRRPSALAPAGEIIPRRFGEFLLLRADGGSEASGQGEDEAPFRAALAAEDLALRALCAFPSRTLAEVRAIARTVAANVEAPDADLPMSVALFGFAEMDSRP